MAFLDILNPFKRSIENPSVPIAQALKVAIYGQQTSTGIAVNDENALTFSGFYAGLRVISETLAQISLKLYKTTDKGKEEARDNDLYYLVNESPNNIMTSFVWRETMQNNTLISGNGLSIITRDNRGLPVSLQVWNPRGVQQKIKDGNLYYDIPDFGIIPSDDVIHIQTLSVNGLWGKGIIEIASESIGSGLAAQKYTNKLYSNGANVSGVLMHPSSLKPEGAEKLRNSWQKANAGLNNAHGTAVLEEGMKYQRIALTPEEAQMIDAKRFTVEEMARVMRIPPHMLADLSRSTNNNIEHQSLEFEKYSIMPWVVKWEQELNKKLLTPSMKKEGYFFKFNTKSLVRGDLNTRTQHYIAMIQNGVYSPNEVRAFEDMNRRDGGDVYLTPLNMDKNIKDNE